MGNTIKFLVALLVVQILLAAGISLSKPDVTAKAKPVAFVQFEQDNIDDIVLEGADKDEKVHLRKQDDHWVLPQQDNFPANETKITELLNRLATMQVTRPIATSANAQERFEVSDNKFERRITLASKGKNLVRIYLGTSPSMHITHAREENSDAIHAIKMSSYEVPVQKSGWEDKSLLNIDKSSIAQITVNGLTLQPKASDSEDESSSENDASTEAIPSTTWQAVGLADGIYLDSDAVNSLADTLANIQYESVMGKEDKTEYKLSEPVLSIKVTTQTGDTITYLIGKQDSGGYILKTSLRPEYFKLANYRATALIDDAKLETLTPVKPKEETTDDKQQTEENSH